MPLPMHRYMSARTFANQLALLRVYGRQVSESFLEQLEELRIVLPRLRIRFPDPVARRLWLDRYPDRIMKHEVEPDGKRWEAAVELSNSLFRWANQRAYGPSAHPFDDLDTRFGEFVQRPADEPFTPWEEMRIDVSNDQETILSDRSSVQTYYCSWQILLAAEVFDMGIHCRVNLADDNHDHLRRAVARGQIPEGSHVSFALNPIRCMQSFRRYKKVLDAVVWFAEETNRALNRIASHHTGRSLLAGEEQQRYHEARRQAATDAAQRFYVSNAEMVELCRLLTGRWSHWDGEGRPLIAAVYKDFLADTVVMTQLLDDLNFQQVCERVGLEGRGGKGGLKAIWRDWREEEKDRVIKTLRAQQRDDHGVPVGDNESSAFAEFLADNYLETFFWRLKSFEEHAFGAHDFALEGMQSDLQGMAVCIEHVVRALGGTDPQLYRMFKTLWQEPEVSRLLKRHRKLAEQGRQPDQWQQVKQDIDALRAQGDAGKIVADLIMAHRLRGAVHHAIPEENPFELERLFVTLIRAAALTYVEVYRQNTASDHIKES